jgi:hypothetical protein
MNPLLSRTFKHQRRLRNNLFSWYVDERGCELRRLLYSKREKPVSSKNKTYFHATAVPTLWKTLRAAMRQRAQTEEVKREVAIK